MKLTRDLLNAVHSKTEGRCWYCGVPLPPFSDWQVDHQIPRSRNGEDGLFNLAPACRGCNIRKSNKTVEEYRHSLLVKIEHRISDAIEFVETVEGYSNWPNGEPPRWTTEIISLLTSAAKSAIAAKPQFYGEQYRNQVFQGVIALETEA